MGGAGKLFGLHSGDGHQLWSLGFAAGKTPERVLPWRTSHDTSQVPWWPEPATDLQCHGFISFAGSVLPRGTSQDASHVLPKGRACMY